MFISWPIFGLFHSSQDYSDDSHPGLSVDVPETKDWIDEWATQVLEQNQKKSPVCLPRGVLSKIPSPVYTRAKLPPAAPVNTPKTDLTPTSPPKQRTVSLSAVNLRVSNLIYSAPPHWELSEDEIRKDFSHHCGSSSVITPLRVGLDSSFMCAEYPQN